MNYSDFFKALGINATDRFAVKRFADASGVSVDRLQHYNDSNTVPSGCDLDRICSASGLSPTELMLKMGVLDRRILKALKANAREVFELIQDDVEYPGNKMEPPPVVFQTNFGRLHQGDCLALMQHMESDTIDVIFADPPFNLKKLYPSGVNDDLKEVKYLEWCESWAAECARLLRP